MKNCNDGGNGVVMGVEGVVPYEHNNLQGRMPTGEGLHGEYHKSCRGCDSSRGKFGGGCMFNTIPCLIDSEKCLAALLGEVT